jgi:Tfp pilus assembly protein PilZ
MDEDKRKFVRVECREPIQYRTSSDSGFVGSLAYDIGEGGLRFQTDSFIPLKEPLSVNLVLNPEMSLSIHGQVVWVQMVPHSDRYHIGLKFDDSDAMAHYQKLIQKYVHSRQEQFR